MKNSISWITYGSAIGVVVLIYYTVVIVVYYKQELRNYLRRIFIKLIPQKQVVQLDSTDSGSISETSIVKPSGNLISDLLNALRMQIKTAAAKKYPREELILALQIQLQDMGEILGPNRIAKINKYIANECEKYCSIHLSEEEVSVLWEK